MLIQYLGRWLSTGKRTSNGLRTDYELIPFVHG